MSVTGGSSIGVVLLGAAILLNAISNALFKSASGMEAMSTGKLALLGAGLGIGLINTLCYIKALESVELGIAFPVLSGGSILLVALVSFLVFGEQLTLRQGIGLATLGAGLALVWWK